MDPQILQQIYLMMMLREMQNQEGPQSRRSGPNMSSLMRFAESFGGGSAGGATATQVGASGTAGTTGAVSLGSGGVATIPAGTSVPAGYTAVGTSANGGTMVVPTSMSGANAGATTSSAGSSVGSYALPVAVAAAQMNNVWEGGLKDIARGRGNRQDWTNDAINRTPQGAIINMGLRAFGKRSLGSMMGSGKSDAQRIRDDFRGDLKSLGVADDKYQVKLADGTTFNIGLDGKTRYKNVGENIDGKTDRQAWDVDFSNPLAKFATDRLDPLIRQRYGQDDASKKYFPGQYTGMLVNAVTSNAKSEQDILRNIESVLGNSELAQQMAGGQQQQRITRPGRGQVARVSPGMYMNDKGQVVRASGSGQAMQQAYGNNRIPRKGRR